MSLTRAGSLDPRGGRSCALWHRLLRRSASESGTLCHGPKEGAITSGGHGLQGNPVQVPDSPSIPTSIPSEFPRIAFSGRALGQDEIDAAIQTTSTSKVRRVDFGGCGPPQPSVGCRFLHGRGSRRTADDLDNGYVGTYRFRTTRTVGGPSA
jgi:hypothetical protein